MSFSMETEKENKLLFLDVEIIPEQGKFTTTIYWNPTFSGVTLKVIFSHLLKLDTTLYWINFSERDISKKMVTLKTLLTNVLKSF